MSGGEFDYIQFNLDDIVEKLDSIIANMNYSEIVNDEIRNGREILHKAAIYLHRIDYLLSGDDGEESFLRRLKEDLNEY